ncbi:hypothetical protein ALC62_04749 [Cyphomyrmex costatus]|uniref:Mariner Mos1 transposase n=1 Tax=Cyphomyrmex costatus TaxID=456900 RepID=A0A195CTI6_9HYME|nr:hypothetical protein ALC62_04749 [Cyphomyrmex costatus]
MKPTLVADEMFPEGAGPYVELEEQLAETLNVTQAAISKRGDEKWIFFDNAEKPFVAQRSTSRHKTCQENVRSILLGVLYHAAYLPDCAPSDYHLFSFFRHGIHLLSERWEKVVSNDGQYFDW